MNSITRHVVVLVLGLYIFPCFSFAHAENLHAMIEVVAADFRFVPNLWSVKSGETVSIVLDNHDKQKHEWVLLKLGTKVTLPFDEDDEEKVFWEIETDPAMDKSATFTAPIKPGTYDIICGIVGHLDRGMRATLIVK